MISESTKTLIKSLPKAELHLHIEGSLEPELFFEIARRNGLPVAYSSVDELRQAYNFRNLQEFLDLYYAGAGVLVREQDFYDLTKAYLQKMYAQNVVHTEIFFDPQTHTSRGVKFETVYCGIKRATDEAREQMNISSELIMCFLRDLGAEAAMETLEMALPYKSGIIGVGLDSSEVGFPPSLFRDVFEKAQAEGFLTVAHAGEEGPVSYVREAIDLLHVSRIDHGNSATADPELLRLLADKKIPLTMCPLSNRKLQVQPDLRQHPLKKMMEQGIVVTVNSDDPAYFGGYINENYFVIADALNLTPDEIKQLACNSFDASFIDEEQKQYWKKKVWSVDVIQ